MTLKKKIIIILLIIVVVLAGFNTYFIFSNNVKNIKSVRVQLKKWQDEADNKGYYYLEDIRNDITFKTNESILLVKKLNKELIKYNKPITLSTDIYSAHFFIEYDYLFGIKKKYHVAYENFKKLKYLKKLYELPDFKEAYKIANSKAMKNGKYVWAYTTIGDNFDDNYKHPEKLIYNMDLDLQNRTFEEEIDKNNILGTVEFSGKKNGEMMTIPIHKTDKYTLKWLNDNNINMDFE